MINLDRENLSKEVCFNSKVNLVNWSIYLIFFFGFGRKDFRLNWIQIFKGFLGNFKNFLAI